jgi:uridine kinase
MRAIGISGPSGAGKTILSEHLRTKIKNCCLIQQDWYFVDPDLCAPNANFCDLKYLYLEIFITDVQKIIYGQEVTVPIVDYYTFKQTNKVRKIVPGDTLIVEGMTIFRIPEIVELLMHKYYLAPQMEIIRQRKMERDLKERNKPIDIILNQLKWVEAEYLFDLSTLPPDVQIFHDCEIIDLVSHSAASSRNQKRRWPVIVA